MLQGSMIFSLFPVIPRTFPFHVFREGWGHLLYAYGDLSVFRVPDKWAWGMASAQALSDRQG